MNILTCLLALVVLAYTSASDIAGYTPSTDVSDHANLDLDQKAIEDALKIEEVGEQGFVLAKNIYENGGHSKSYAELNVTSSIVEKAAGTEVLVKGDSAPEVMAKLYEEATGEAIIKVQYNTVSTCHVGGLAENDRDISECFEESGVVTIDGVEYPYAGYDVAKTKNGRTLQGFSLSTEDKMYKQSDACPECPYETFKEYYNFYGDFGYGDKIVQAALTKGIADLRNMDVDFSNKDFLGRVEGVKKGTTYLNLFMYVISEMEDAFANCDIDTSAAKGAWDKAVAFYTGSLEGPGTEGKTAGKFLFRLAEKRCQQFKTCGYNGDSTDGTAKVNLEIFRHFGRGQRLLSERKCPNVRNTVDKIIRLMAIPMIQGALRYAHKLGVTDSATITGEVETRSDKSVMEGHIFTMAVLPMINRCNADDAEILKTYMGASASETDFHQVQRAFERNYPCLGIKCSDVGGIYSEGVKTYLTGGEPCRDKTSSGGSSNSASTISIVLGVAAAVVAVVSIIGIFYMGAREKRGKPIFKESTEKEMA